MLVLIAHDNKGVLAYLVCLASQAADGGVLTDALKKTGMPVGPQTSDFDGRYIYRHRDNLEAFLVMQGKRLMVTADWSKFPGRERAFEIRTMLPGAVVLIRGGQFHGLINSLDENVRLFMFGGYD